MNDTSTEKIANKVFGELADDSSFSQSLTKLFDLTAENWQILFEKYLSSPYRYYYCHHSEELAAFLKIDGSAAHGLFHIFDLLAYTIIPDNDLDEIINALKYLELEDDKIAVAKPIFIELQKSETRQKVRVLDLIDDEIGTVNLHLPRIVYHIDQRMIFDKEKPINKLDIVLLSLEARHDKIKKLTFELTEYDIDHFIKSFELIKRKLENLRKSSFGDGQKL